MSRTNQEIWKRAVRRMGVGFAVLTLFLFAGVELSRAAEIVPSYGLMRSVDQSDSKSYVNLAVRGNLLPAVQTEIAVGYRNEPRFGDQLHVKMLPVTGSLWLTPVPAVYAGGGVGWYHTTFDYAAGTGLPNETHEEFGVHLGGGLRVPIVPRLAADLGGRYVMMRDQQSRLIPEKFNPDFWVMSLGLAISL